MIRDLETKKYGDAVIQTRFSSRAQRLLAHRPRQGICLDFGLADEFAARPTSASTTPTPRKEEQEYVDSITKDVRWLGFEWDGLYYASDYFDQLYQWAVKLIQDGKAYVE